MLRAVKHVKCDHKSIRGVAREFDILFRTLTHYCNKITDEQLKSEKDATVTVGYVDHKKGLSDEQEKEFSS